MRDVGGALGGVIFSQFFDQFHRGSTGGRECGGWGDDGKVGLCKLVAIVNLRRHSGERQRSLRSDGNGNENIAPGSGAD